MKQFVEQLELYKQNRAVALLVCLLQLSLNLTGQSKTFFSGFMYNDDGDAMQLETFYHRFFDDADDNNDQGVIFRNLKFATLLLAYIFQDIHEIENLFDDWTASSGVVTKSHFMNLYVKFFSSLAAFSIYRSTKRRYYYLKALSAISSFQKLSKKSGINAMPLEKLLKAEKGSFVRKKDTSVIKKKYDEAIVTFARSGLTHLQAIACERAGDFMASQDEPFWSKDYYERSVQSYTEWGAIAKAKLLCTQHGLDCGTPGQDSTGRSPNSDNDMVFVSLRGRRRYDETIYQTIAKTDVAETSVISRSNSK